MDAGEAALRLVKRIGLGMSAANKAGKAEDFLGHKTLNVSVYVPCLA